MSRLLAPVLLALGLLSACSGGEETTIPRRVVLVGVESLSLDYVENMVARGELPHLAKMMDEGVRAKLRCPDPLQSPMLWATALTGQPANRHRVTAEYVHLGEYVLPSPSTARAVPTLFQICSQNTALTASIGFPGSWPAEILNGFNLSYGAIPGRLTEASENTFPRRPRDRAAFPAKLYDRAMAHYTSVDELDRRDTSPFFTLKEIEFEMLYDEPFGSLYERTNPPRDFAITLQRDRAQVALAKDLLENYPLRLLGVHLELPEAMQAIYWRVAWPDLYEIPADTRRRYRNAIDECYRSIDRWIGEIAASAGPGTALCVLGNRGFGNTTDPADDTRIAPGPTNETLFLLSGAGVASGVDLGTMDLLDVAPTLLTLLDLAVGEQMEGRVLERALDAEFRRTHPPKNPRPYTGEFQEVPRFPEQLERSQEAEQSDE